MHRRENHENITEWFTEINELAKSNRNLEFILPLHPNPNVQKHKTLLTHVNVIEPLNHKDLLDILIKTKLVITDSGGIQEECSFFNKKCLVCRKITERPESLNLSSFLVKSPKSLSYVFNNHINNYMINYKSPYGDGHATKKIIKVLKNLIN